MLGMYEYPFIKRGQPGSEVLTFMVKADDLLSFAKVERFNEAEEGVQRRLHYSHVLKLADYMRQADAELNEPILGDLRGPWAVDDKKNVIRRQDKSSLLVDEGQQRLAALLLLTPEERSRWEFEIVATMNTPYQVRLKRFIQQTKRLKLDTQLVLQIQDRGNLFPDELSKTSYHLAKRLATEKSSPLCGIIRLEEREARKQPIGADAETLAPILGQPPATKLREETLGVINVTGIMRDLRLVTSSVHSLLRYHKPEQQFEVICRLLQAAKERWPDEWQDPKPFFLRRSDGIAALLQLFVVGQSFKSCLSVEGTKWNPRATQKIIASSPEAISKALGYAKYYDWSFSQFRRPDMKFPRPTEIARQLDALIYQGMPKSFRQPGKKAKVTA